MDVEFLAGLVVSLSCGLGDWANEANAENYRTRHDSYLNRDVIGYVRETLVRR